MATLTRRLAVALVVGGITLAACGDPLVTTAYRGAPYWSVEVDVQRTVAPRGTSIRLALFFSPRLDTRDLDALIELPATAVETTAPASVIVNAYEKPGEAWFARDDRGTSLGYGVARLLAYVDANHNERRDADEPFIAAARASAYLFLPSDKAAGQTPARASLGAGFYELLVPQPCNYTPPSPTSPGDCGVPLGSECRSDADCGTGICLRETKFPWPAGYCAITEPPRDGCRPGAGAYYHAPLYSLSPAGAAGFYLRRCQADADCKRAHEQNYHCDRTLLACVPAATPVVESGGGPVAAEVEPLCAGTPRLMPMPPP